MKFQNYLLELTESLDDTSIRIFGVTELVNEMWTKLNNRGKLLTEWKISKSTMRNYLRKNRGIPISVCYKIAREYSKQTNTDLNNLWDEIFYKVNLFKSESSGSKQVKLPRDLTEDLAYFIGALRDGCLATYSQNPNHFGVLIAQESCIEWLEKTIIPIIEKLFGLKPNLRKEIQIYNKTLFKFIEKVFEMPPGNQKIWSTPKIIEESPLKLQIAYIKGFFDAEGTFIPKVPLLGFFQKNRDSLLFIKKKLKKLNIKSGKISWDRRVWRFWISGKDSITAFIKEIGTSHPDKTKRFEQYLSTSDHRGTLAEFRTS